MGKAPNFCICHVISATSAAEPKHPNNCINHRTQRLVMFVNPRLCVYLYIIYSSCQVLNCFVVLGRQESARKLKENRHHMPGIKDLSLTSNSFLGWSSPSFLLS